MDSVNVSSSTFFRDKSQNKSNKEFLNQDLFLDSIVKKCSNSDFRESIFSYFMSVSDKLKKYKSIDLLKLNQEEEIYYDLKRIIEDNSSKVLSKPSSIESLKEFFPNFVSVIEDIDSKITLASLHKNKHFSLPPILLNGYAGIGKTYFLQKLKEKFNSDFFKVDCNLLTSKFYLTGNSLQWGNSKFGLLFENSFKSKFLNNVWLFDEFDKIDENQNSNPLPAFYSLLDINSSSEFSDEYFDVKFDMSNNYFFFTSNSTKNLDQALLSRLVVYEIEKPSKEQLFIIIKNIYREKIIDYDFFDKELSDSTAEFLSEFDSIRDFKNNLDISLARAFKSKRQQILPEDFDFKKNDNKLKIGFV